MTIEELNQTSLDLIEAALKPLTSIEVAELLMQHDNIREDLRFPCIRAWSNKPLPKSLAKTKQIITKVPENISNIMQGRLDFTAAA